jgi:hypothetical protein
MGRPAVLTVKILGDSKGARDALQQTESDVDRSGQAIATMSRGATVALAAVAGGFAYSAKAASDQQQAVGAMTAVFGTNSAAMLKNAEAADRIGLSTAGYAQNAAVLGSLLSGAGVAQDQLAGSTDNMIGLSADMAAQFGGSTSDAVGALSSMLKGSYEVLDNYGVKMTASQVASYAAANGMTTAEAQLAILHQQLTATGTIGAWNREIDTAASTTQQMQANVTDASAELGDAFLPIVSDASKEVSKFSTWVKDNSSTVKTAIGVFSALAAMVVIVNGIIKAATAATAAYNAVMAIGRTIWLLGATAGYIFAGAEMAALWPIALIVLGIAALIAIIVLLVKNWDTVTAVMKKLWDWVKNVFGAVWGWLSDQVQKVIDVLKKVWDWITKIIDSGVGKIMDILPFAGSMALTSTVTALGPAATAAAPRSGRSTGGAGPTINFYGPVTDPEATARAIARTLRDSDRRNGRTPAQLARAARGPAW